MAPSRARSAWHTMTCASSADAPPRLDLVNNFEFFQVRLLGPFVRPITSVWRRRGIVVAAEVRRRESRTVRPWRAPDVRAPSRAPVAGHAMACASATGEPAGLELVSTFEFFHGRPLPLMDCWMTFVSRGQAVVGACESLGCAKRTATGYTSVHFTHAIGCGCHDAEPEDSQALSAAEIIPRGTRRVLNRQPEAARPWAQCDNGPCGCHTRPSPHIYTSVHLSHGSSFVAQLLEEKWTKIYTFRPRHLAVTGIAAGARGSFGDIVVSDQVWDYGIGKIAYARFGRSEFLSSRSDARAGTSAQEGVGGHRHGETARAFDAGVAPVVLATSLSYSPL
jgi:hypothetical protein